MNPTGGLARRKTVLNAVKGSLLVLDSGNALFPNAGVASELDKTRAKFVLSVMDELGTRAMAVGQRDVSAGSAFLLEAAKKGKVKLLSANVKRDGTALFDASTVVDVGGVKVAVIGVTAPGPVVPNEPTVVAGPTLESVRAALKALPAHEVTIVLAATNYADALQLSTELGAAVDFVIQSGEFRGTQPPQRMSETSSVLLASGQKGQAVGKIELTLGKGKEPMVDLSIIDRDRQQADFVGEQIKTLEERLKLAKDKDAIAQLKVTLEEFKKRRADLVASVAKKVAPDVRAFNFGWTLLNRDVEDEPKLKARVLVIDPQYAGSH